MRVWEPTVQFTAELADGVRPIIRDVRHLDAMQFQTLIRCRVPRCECPEHGVLTAKVPWAGKNSRFTLMFEAFAVRVLQACSTVEGARRLKGFEKLGEDARERFHVLKESGLQVGRARAIKDAFQEFWTFEFGSDAQTCSRSTSMDCWDM